MEYPIIGANIDPELEKELQDRDSFEYSNIIQQARSEYDIAVEFVRPKWDEYAARMKLYNNQKRSKLDFGDPLLFSIMQTQIAALYENKMSVQFLGREQGDVYQASNLNALAKYDYDAMMKSTLDYYWLWDAGFFGKSCLLFTEWNKKLQMPIPHKIDMMTMYWDPRCISLDGHFGKGGARFWGREILMTKEQMEKHPDFFDVDMVGTSTDAYDSVNRAEEARSEMNGTQSDSAFRDVQGDNRFYQLREHYSLIEGEKYVTVFANNGGTPVMHKKLKDQSTWGVIEREIYPVSGSFLGTSIPDLIEDKQRQRAKLMNLVYKKAEFGVYPQYLYDASRLTNASELTRPDSNKFIGIDGEVSGAVQPLQHDSINTDVQWILDTLNYQAEKSTATPAISQGATPDTSRTATERSIQQQNVDKRYALAAKIISNSEQKFWKQWYRLYKMHFKEADEKILRIVGPVGYEFRPLSREDIITQEDPDIKIEDSVISESMRLQKLQALSNVAQILAQNPQLNRGFLDKELARLSGLDPDQVNLLIPKTSEELHAEEENKLLSENKKATIDIKDDHMVHIEVHNRATDTPAKRAHIKTHYIAMMKARTMKNDLPLTENGVAGVPQDQQPVMGETPTEGNNQDQSQISPTRLNFTNPNIAQ